jgi:hypothetical protein
MSRKKRGTLILGLVVLLVLVAPGVGWVALTYQPRFYRMRIILPRAQRRQVAKRFEAQSLQLYNDIHNEPRWEAIFTDQEVNAWLAEYLVTQFGDHIPQGIHEPRVLFENDRVTLAFQLDRGPLRSVVWVVARVRVPGDNQVALTLEKIRAGIVPISAEWVIERITDQVRLRGFEIEWKTENDLPVALIRYQPESGRNGVVLESLLIRDGEIRLAGRSTKVSGALVMPTLLRGKVRLR